MIWFGILIAINLQTSFLTPPFGFALFFLRSVAPNSTYTDKITGKRIERVKTTHIYKGALPFVGLQLIVIALLIAFPQLTIGNAGLDEQINVDEIRIEIMDTSDDGWGGDSGW